MAQAFPDAKTLFLYRDLRGWTQSMERLIRVREQERQEREAHAPTAGRPDELQPLPT